MPSINDGKTRERNRPFYARPKNHMQLSLFRSIVLLFFSVLFSFSINTRALSYPTMVKTLQIGEFPKGLTVLTTTNPPKLYVAHAVSGNVSVFRAEPPFEQITTIALQNTSGHLGAAAVNETTKKIYIIDRNNNQVHVIDGNTDTELTGANYPIPTGDGPEFLAINENTNRVYVSNYATSTVTVIDSNTDLVVDTIRDNTGLVLYLAINTKTNKLYVSNMTTNEILVYNGANNALLSRIQSTDLTPGFAIDQEHNLIYFGHENDGVSVIDGTTDTIIPDLFFNRGGYFVLYHPTLDLLYTADWSIYLFVFVG